MLQPASFSKPFMVGAVGFEKISVVPWIFLAGGAEGAFRCLIMNSSSFIIDLIGWLVAFDADVVDAVVDGAFVSSTTLFPCRSSSMKLVKFDVIFLKPGITPPCLASSWVFWFMGEVKVFSVEVTFDLCSCIVGAAEINSRMKVGNIFQLILLSRVARASESSEFSTHLEMTSLRSHYSRQAIVRWQLLTLHHRCFLSDWSRLWMKKMKLTRKCVRQALTIF